MPTVTERVSDRTVADAESDLVDLEPLEHTPRVESSRFSRTQHAASSKPMLSAMSATTGLSSMLTSPERRTASRPSRTARDTRTEFLCCCMRRISPSPSQW